MYYGAQFLMGIAGEEVVCARMSSKPVRGILVFYLKLVFSLPNFCCAYSDENYAPPESMKALWHFGGDIYLFVSSVGENI